MRLRVQQRCARVIGRAAREYAGSVLDARGYVARVSTSLAFYPLIPLALFSLLSLPSPVCRNFQRSLSNHVASPRAFNRPTHSPFHHTHTHTHTRFESYLPCSSVSLDSIPLPSSASLPPFLIRLVPARLCASRTLTKRGPRLGRIYSNVTEFVLC